MKRTTAFVLSAAMLLSMTGTAFAEDAGTVKDDVTYTLKFWHCSTDDLRQEAYDHAIERFNEAYPNITVEQTRLDSDAYKTKIKTVMGAGGGDDMPDIFINWGGDALKTYVDAGLVVDITEYVEPFKDEYYDFEFGLSTFNDSIYGMGFGIAPASVFYNKEIFEEVGVEPPTTYEEMDEVCAKLKEAGYIPFALGNKNKWPGLLEYTMLGVDLGGKEMSEGLMNRTVSFDNEVFAEAGRRLQDFLHKGYYPEGCNGIDHNTGGTRMMFYNGLCGMFIMVDNFLSNCQAEDPEFYSNIGIFPYPVCDPQTTGGVLAGGNPFSVSTACEYPQIAADFLHYLTDATTSQFSLDNGGAFTGAKDVTISDPLVQSQFDRLMNASWTQNYYDQQFVAEVGEAFKDATQALYGDTMTPEEAAAMIEAAAEAAYGPVHE